MSGDEITTDAGAHHCIELPITEQTVEVVRILAEIADSGDTNSALTVRDCRGAEERAARGRAA